MVVPESHRSMGACQPPIRQSGGWAQGKPKSQLATTPGHSQKGYGVVVSSDSLESELPSDGVFIICWLGPLQG